MSGFGKLVIYTAVFFSVFG